MRAALLILGKDLRLRARDRTVYILGLGAPLALAAILGLVVGGFAPGEVDPPRWAVVGGDNGDIGRSLTDQVLPGVASGLGGEVRLLPDRDAAVQALEDDEIDAAFVVPSTFTFEVQRGRTPELEVLGRVGAEIPTTIATAVAESFAADVAVVSAVAPLVPPERLRGARAPDGYVLVEGSAVDRTLDGPTYVAAGMAVFFVFFTVGLGVIGLLEERQLGTYGRLAASPVPAGSILAGKILTSIVIGYAATVTLFVASTFLLGASWGPTIPVLVLMFAAVLAAVALVTVVAGFAESADAANNVQGVIGIVLGMLGGAFFPVATEPGPLATASDLTPHGMFITAVGDLQVPGAGFGDIAPQLLGLLAFAMITVTAAGAIGRLREEAS